MLKSGYIVLNDYDKTRISDRAYGEKVRLSFMTHINKVIDSTILPDKAQIIKSENNVSILFEDRDGNSYQAFICTINHLVNRNKIFMKQHSTVLPFIKGMDKYGTVYISISTQSASSKAQVIIDGFIERFIDELNNPVNSIDGSGFLDTFKFVPAIKKEELVSV